MGRLVIALAALLALAAHAQEPPEVYRTFTGRLVVKVDDFEGAAERAKSALPADRGTLLNIETSRTTEDLDEMHLEYVVRADYAEELLDSLTALGEVLVEDSDLTDVTERVQGLREEVDALTARVGELQERADRPGLPMDDRIAVQRELSRERSELERASSTLSKLLADTETFPVEVTLVEGHIDRLTAVERVLFTIVLPGVALLVAAFFLGRLVGRRGGGKDA
jgi:hypothetical protein